MSNLCQDCGKPLVDDGQSTAPVDCCSCGLAQAPIETELLAYTPFCDATKARAQRIKDGAMRIAAGLYADASWQSTEAQTKDAAIALAVLIEDAGILEKTP